ncbi:arrestin domain-containing protein 3-like [Brienomyrus brachyistius]|uniref:arrestin domain-containing protein 3-like n=1 Tax=Brienomyrus brachyistius TaxID=42636 RepID=UPI0020B2C0C6|nr:arrestin domain-containing protein 3-like [Brienomyrus brachyistius]
MWSPVTRITVEYEAVNEEGSFSCGDELSGRVLLLLSKDTKIKDIWVKASGQASVHWSEGSGDDQRTYSATEKYFKLKQQVAGPEKGKKIVLAAGSHVFPFTFQIPQGNMPSSFKGAHGKVEYKLEAKLSRSWRLPSNAASEFTFVSKPEMSLAQLMSPQQGNVTKKMKVFTSGNVTISVNMEQMAYWPAEGSKVTVDIQNNSSRDLAPKVAVDQVQSFFAEGSRNISSHRVLKHVGEPIPANTQQTLTLVLKLPPNLPASIPNCGIIRVEYFVKVYLDVPLAIDPEVKLPLVILPAELSTGAFPYQTAPGAAPFPTAPGGFPYKPLPGADAPLTAPGGFPYQPSPGAVPLITVPGGFPYQPSPGAVPLITAPGGFPYQPSPGAAPPITAPGGFPYQPAPGAAPPITAPGGFPYQPAPGAAPPIIAPGGFPYQPPQGEPYTFLSYSSPDAPPPYDILGQHSPQSFPGAPPSYSDAIKCQPPTAPGCSLPQMPQGAYPLRGALNAPQDAFKSFPSSHDSSGKGPI